MKHYPLVEVTWRDAVGFGEHFKVDEIPSRIALPERTTSGYLIYQDDKMVVVAGTLDPEDDEVDDVTAIPAPWKVRRVRRPKPKKRRKKR